MLFPLVVVALGASPVCGAKAPEDALRRKGVQCAAVKKQPGPGDLVTLTERCRWPDGSKSEDRIAVAPSSAGWRVVVTE